jgi:PAS domain S-box-containing protein
MSSADSLFALDSAGLGRLIAAAPDLYLILDADLTIVGASNAYVDATMTKRESIVGSFLFDVFPDNPNDPNADGEQNLRSSLEAVLRERVPHQMDIQKYDIRKPDSAGFEVRYWSPMNTPVINPKGEVEWIIHRVEDVTDMLRMSESDEKRGHALVEEILSRKQAEDELTRFFQLSIDMLCISSADGYFKRLSPAFTDVLGWSVDEMLSRPFMDFVHPDDAEKTVKEVERQVGLGQKVLDFENRFRHRDGSWRLLSWKSVPQPDGMMYACARDVTDLKATQIEISQLNEGLVRRAAELEVSREEAERANRAKSEFMSRMSHELRTPLNAVLGYSQLLELRSTDARTLECAAAIVKGGRHLLELVEEILDLSRIDEGSLGMSLQSVPLSATIHHAAELVRPSADERQISLTTCVELQNELCVSADGQRLLQILLNLLSNAIKYNRVGGQVEIRCLEATEGEIRVEVSDTGPGIGDQSEDWLFEPFERGANTEVEGTGLGLALSRNLARLMGGDVRLLCSSELGSTFALQLRRATPPETR